MTGPSQTELPPLPAELADLTPQQLREEADVDRLLRFTRVLIPRAQEVLDYWQPLLQSCREGTTKVPVKDLRSTVSRVRAVSAALYDVDHPRADRAVEALRKTEEALERWLPEQRGSHLVQGAAYEAGDGPRPEQKPDRRRLHTLITVAVVLALFAGGQRLLSMHRVNAEEQLQAYRSAVPEVLDREIVAKTLVLTVDATWRRKPADDRRHDIIVVLEETAAEPFNDVKVIGTDGQTLARVSSAGLMDWAGPLREKAR